MYINLNSNNHNHTTNKIITIDKENKKRKQNIMKNKVAVFAYYSHHKSYSLSSLYYLIIYILLLTYNNNIFVSSECPNLCSGHGDCTSKNRCNCWRADKVHDTYWIGGDCSLRQCPRDIAWQDVASGTDYAHTEVECSNAGYCDRQSGHCTCLSGRNGPLFEGAACERMTCPLGCNGHGTCTSNRQIAKTHGGRYDVKGHIPYVYDNWDAHKIYSCDCDTDYFGYDCSLRSCPRGDDPLTANQAPEIQSITCMGSRRIKFGFRDAYTPFMKAGSTANEIKLALQKLPTIEEVEVDFVLKGESSCTTSTPPQTMQITFHNPGGDLPLMTLGDDAPGGEGNSIGIFEFQKGSTEDLDCAGRGVCDTIEGICRCNFMYASSDGHGNVGERGDCGFLDDNPFEAGFVLNENVVERSAKLRVSSCPSQIDGVSCTDHGICSGAPSWQCTCSEGWTGGDCSLRTCPYGNAWSDIPTLTNFAHGFTECSNVGLCDREKGICICRDGFTGSACDRLDCPKHDTKYCSGHGKCLTMRQLARKASTNGEPTPYVYGSDPNNGNTWDADKIMGCYCDEGYTGIACRDLTCPFGDDPMTNGVNEIQVFTCEDSSSNPPNYDTSYIHDSTTNVDDKVGAKTGPQFANPNERKIIHLGGSDNGNSIGNKQPYFQLKFRGEITTPIYPMDDVYAVQTALESLPTIGGVVVTFKNSKTICGPTGHAITTTIEFLTETGGSAKMDNYYRVTTESPPPIRLDSKSNDLSIVFAEDTIQKEINGIKNVNSTTENNLCSDRGLCNRLLGECECFSSYTSKTNRGNKGTCDRVGKYLAIDAFRL